MTYFIIFDNLDHKLRAYPDFPQTKTARLWQMLPPYSKQIAAIIYLLPFGDDVSEKEIAYAETLSVLTLSVFVHDDMSKGRAFDVKEAVLYGDYLFALAFSLLPDTVTKEDGKRVAERVCRYNEKWLTHHNATPENRDEILFAKEDYGALLKDIATEAMVKNEWKSPLKDQYEQCAETLGTLWGILCEKYPVNPDPLFQQAETEINGLPMVGELMKIWKELKEASLEYKLEPNTTEK